MRTANYSRRVTPEFLKIRKGCEALVAPWLLAPLAVLAAAGLAAGMTPAGATPLGLVLRAAAITPLATHLMLRAFARIPDPLERFLLRSLAEEAAGVRRELRPGLTRLLALRPRRRSAQRALDDAEVERLMASDEEQ